MRINYYDLPFGAQLLLWTSRILIKGSCRTNPDKYRLVDIAYKKVGITNGSLILRAVLLFFKRHESFRLQSICNQILIEDEINLINCIEKNKDNKFNNNHFIKIWSISDKKYNLNTNINELIYIENIPKKTNFINNTLH